MCFNSRVAVNYIRRNDKEVKNIDLEKIMLKFYSLAVPIYVLYASKIDLIQVQNCDLIFCSY